MNQRLKELLALIGSELSLALGGGGGPRRSRWPRFELGVCAALLVMQVYAIAWLGDPADSQKPEKQIIVGLSYQFAAWLVVLHYFAWFVRRWVPKNLLGVLDYFYLGSAALGLTISALRQEVEHSQYAALWFPTALPWLVAALALRLTKTSIELFGWYRRPAPT